ncbi:calcium incorporation protein MxaA [Cupriavidus necator]|uniref:calcium incorporation protein MxaA n=1 Tax=Cupriavidus necator TaxID=106590 RepID=UPI0039C4916D
MTHRRFHLPRLAGVACQAMIAFAMVPPAALAQESTVAATAVVQQPRAFGHVLGDVVTQRILLPADGRTVDPAALPRPERVSGWLERRPVQWETDAEGRRWMRVTYQIVNAPQSLTAIALPVLSLPMTRGPALRTGAHLISVGPLTPQAVLGKGDLLEMRPDRPVPILPTAQIARRMELWLAALSVTVAAWLGWWAWRNRRESRRLPFARAWRRMRQLDPAQSEAWLCLHQALNETAGTVLRAATLPGLLARAPHLQPLCRQLQHFYAQSDQRFFSGEAAAESFPLRALCRDLYLAEKRARP